VSTKEFHKLKDDWKRSSAIWLSVVVLLSK
jgi:hypothetical protein